MLGLARLVTGAGGGHGPSLNFNFVDGSAFSPQITFTRASSATYFNSSGVLTSAGNDEPRFDYDPSTLAARGFLIEEARTNSIRNNTMVGAVAGTPGTAPTNWTIDLAPGVTREVVGTGTEDGITYVDIKLSGTPSGGTNVAINFEPINQIAASSGQTWTESVFVKLQAGSFTNTTTTLSLLATDGTSGIQSFTTPTITSTPSNLRECRLSVTGAFTNVSITHAQPRVRVGITVGAAIDITLRIGLPQLELGAFATSVIPTTTTALTRSADVASVNTLSPWYNATEGTLFAEFTPYVTTTSTLRSISYIDSSIPLYILQNTSTLRSFDGTTAFATANGITGDVIQKSAVGYGSSSASLVLNAGTVATGSFDGSYGTLTLYLGKANTSANFLNGYLRRITYYPRRLSNAQLQNITA